MLALIVSALVLTIGSPVVKAGSGNVWTYYGDHGPEHWHETYPDCGGVTQSPINIDTDSVLYNPSMKKFDLSEYSRTAGIIMHLVNKGGHTAEVDFTGAKIRLRGGSLPDYYVLSQFHFHWGSGSRRGSEHTLNGKHYPLEMHLVHYQDHLQNISNAASHPSGLAVLGYFFKIGKYNKNFDNLLKHFSDIKKTNQQIEIEEFPLLDLLPSYKVDFFRYDGSLTTPPCYESVIWSISTAFIEIAEEQIKIFRTLYDAEEHPLVDDFRPIQPLNHRTVLTNSAMYKPAAAKQGSSGDSGSHTSSSCVLVGVLLLCSLFTRDRHL